MLQDFLVDNLGHYQRSVMAQRIETCLLKDKEAIRMPKIKNADHTKC